MEMCLVVEAKGFEPSTPCLQSRCYARQFNVVAYGDGDGGAGSGIRTRVTSLEGWCINPYTMPA